MSYQNIDNKRIIQTALDLILISARTAPKSGGVDDLWMAVASKDQQKKIAKGMLDIGKDKASSKTDKTIKDAVVTSWKSDALVVGKSDAVVLFGVRGKNPFGANCGGCGLKTCAEFSAKNEKNISEKIQAGNFRGPFCLFKVWDLGIAVSSAAKTAAVLNVDNRTMYRLGAAAVNLNIKGEISGKMVSIKGIGPILGLPLSISGKNIYFDRWDKLQAAKVLSEYHKK